MGEVADFKIRGAPLEVRQLSKMFGATRVVDDLSFRVEGGAFLTLLGPSGSGKTTTLRMIAGFEDPTEGEIRVADDVVTEAPAHKRNIGVVFQQYALFPHLTVFQNIAYPLEMRKRAKGEIRRRVESVVALVRLQGFESRYPKQLSGGQQQRVALARAIVFEPPVLLMDEPLGALDKRLREVMQVEIRHLQRQLGITTVSVTHDQIEALVMSDVIAVLDRGRLQQIAPPLEAYQRPANQFVADFIGESNLLSGTMSPAQAGRSSSPRPRGSPCGWPATAAARRGVPVTSSSVPSTCASARRPSRRRTAIEPRWWRCSTSGISSSIACSSRPATSWPRRPWRPRPASNGALATGSPSAGIPATV